MFRKKILIIIPSLGVGGAENVLLNFLNLMDYEKYEVDLYVVLKRGVYFDRIPNQVNLKILYNNRFIEKLSRVFYSAFHSLIIHKIFGKRIKGIYDFGLCFTDSEATEYLIYNLATIKRRATVIQSNYNTWDLIANKIRGKYIEQMKRRYNAMDLLIFVSQDAKADFEKIFGTHRCHRVIFNPINTSKIIKKSEEESAVIFDRNTINIVTIGRLIPVKGYDLLLQAAHILHQKKLDFHIYIVGTGPLKKKLTNISLKLELQQKVTITGYIENIYPLVKQADIFVMSSRSEGLPTSLCEAIILGKPVIATNVSGCKEVIDHGKYGLMADLTPVSLALALEQMICSKELRIKFSSLAKERSNIFKDSEVMQQYFDLFEGK
jgi:glycosyltransferase involved in cell wall biosynthesis